MSLARLCVTHKKAQQHISPKKRVSVTCEWKLRNNQIGYHKRHPFGGRFEPGDWWFGCHVEVRVKLH